MNRHSLLGDVSHCMGLALKDMEAAGVELRQRDVLLLWDAFCRHWRDLPELPTRELAESVLRDETQHGGLLGRDTLTRANEISQEPGYSDSKMTR